MLPGSAAGEPHRYGHQAYGSQKYVGVDFEKAQHMAYVQHFVPGRLPRPVYAHGCCKAVNHANPLSAHGANGHAFDAHAHAEYKCEAYSYIHHIGYHGHPHYGA
jgi:hypothetical protein